MKYGNLEIGENKQYLDFFKHRESAEYCEKHDEFYYLPNSDCYKCAIQLGKPHIKEVDYIKLKTIAKDINEIKRRKEKEKMMSTTKNEKLNIYQKMNKVTEDCKQIPKNGENKFAGYKYVMAVDVINEVQKLLVKHGIQLIIAEDEIKRKTYKNKNNVDNYMCQLKCTASFVNIDDKEDFAQVVYYSVSADTLDKDIFKAKTNGLKYLLTQQFLIVTDVLIDSEDPRFQPKVGASADRVGQDAAHLKITENQLKRLFAIQNNTDTYWNGELVGEIINKAFSLKSAKDLNRKQYDWLCEKIQTMSFEEVVGKLDEKKRC